MQVLDTSIACSMSSQNLTTCIAQDVHLQYSTVLKMGSLLPTQVQFHGPQGILLGKHWACTYFWMNSRFTNFNKTSWLSTAL